MADDGAQIVDVTSSQVTLAINHFTGYKVSGIDEEAAQTILSDPAISRSCPSRIPVRKKVTY